jgi:hypothetical protein
MKMILCSFALMALTCCARAQLVTNQPARLETKIISSEGKIGPGVNGSSINAGPDSTFPGNMEKDTVTSPGHESELQWTFVGRNRDKDVYRFTFTRFTKSGSTNKTTTSKEVQFDGKRIIVFEDGFHAVVMESPSEEDLKTVQKR